jgi:hypothetical protein
MPSTVLKFNAPGKPDLLVERAQAMGARLQSQSKSFDVSCIFDALARIKILLNFNDADEMIPAACTLLFNSSARLFSGYGMRGGTGHHAGSHAAGRWWPARAAGRLKPLPFDVVFQLGDFQPQ